MGGVCYRKGLERGLWFLIKCVEDVIASKKKRHLNTRLEEELLKSYKKFTEEEYAERFHDAV